jgi:uncharacterized protein involved in response to NO
MNRTASPRERLGGPATPLLALGFRPFFLLAAAFAALAVPLWLAMLEGLVVPAGRLDPLAWHRHEMVFGYTLAVVAGFLLTAAQSWTARPMPSGGRLLALVLLWLGARAAMVAGTPAWLAIALDVAFPLALAAALWPPLWATRQLRNLGFVPLLGGFALASLAGHLDGPIDAHRVAIGLIVLLLVIMGGRVIPAFTRNALPAAGVRRLEPAEWPSIASVAALVPLELVAAPAPWVAAVALTAAVLNAARMAPWGTLATLRHPILWVLHAGYGWIVVGLALEGLAALGRLAPSLATHALTIGALGSLTLGMMSRVALGHTARPLVPAPAIVLAYVLINLAALVRVVLPLASDDWYRAGVIAAGALWSLAFLLFLVVYAPILARPRLDGRPG